MIDLQKWRHPLKTLQAYRVAGKAALLSQQGRRAEGLARMAEDLGLLESDFAQANRVLSKLQSRLRGCHPDAEAIYVATLAGLAGAEGHYKEASEWFLCDCGIEPEDWRDTDRLYGRLDARFQSLSPASSAFYLQALVGVLGMASMHAEGLAMVEAFLGLEPEAYQERDTLRLKLHDRLSDFPPDFATSILLVLGGALAVTGRSSDAVKVAEADLDLRAGDYHNLSKLTERLRGRLDELAPETAIGYLAMLFVGLQEAGQIKSALAVLEAFAGLKAADYRDSERLALVLQNRLEGLAEEANDSFVMKLTIALCAANRPGDALALYRADAELDADDFKDSGTVAAKLKKHLESRSASLAATYTRGLAAVLSDCGKPDQAVGLLEADAGISDTDYPDFSRLRQHLLARFEGLSEGTAAAFVFQLYSDLELAGKSTKAGQLLECYFRFFARLKARHGRDHYMVSQLCPLCSFWLRRFYRDQERKPLEFCRRLVPFLRDSLAEQGVALEDRQEFIDYVTELRQLIVETGLYWARREQSEQRARQLRRSALLWDADLGQRLVLERFLLGSLQSRQATDPPVQSWPFQEPFNWETEGYLPDPQAALSYGALEAQLSQAQHPEASHQYRSLKSVRPRLFHQAERIVRQGVTEGVLTDSLGRKGLLVRATFGAEGRLLWTAARNVQGRLDIAAWGSGQTEDLETLRWAASKHDFRMAWERFIAGSRGLMASRISEDVEEAINSVANRLEAVGQSDAQSGDRVAEVHEIVGSIASELSSAKRLKSLEFLMLACGPLLHGPSPDSFIDWTRRSTLRLRSYLPLPSRGKGLDLAARLALATDDYLAAVQSHWNLEGMAPHLGPETDVAFQVDGPLYTVPTAHLSIGGRPLYQQTRSTRSILSILFDVLQKEAERDFSSQDSRSRRMLCVSHFSAEDPVGKCAAWLHHGQFRLAQMHGMECWAAAERPPGTQGAISAAFSTGKSFRTMTVCGHGSTEAGVALQDGNWEGGGCDLSLVDWLLLVSCSVGRLGQSSDLDVEGFCVKLAMHRALSVLACRWPVQSVEAVAFANEIVHQYLQLRNAGHRAGDRGCLRARALNLARQKFLGEDGQSSGHPLVGLNTGAAFELYGLG